jgi:hypothetical protein
VHSSSSSSSSSGGGGTSEWRGSAMPGGREKGEKVVFVWEHLGGGVADGRTGGGSGSVVVPT